MMCFFVVFAISFQSLSELYCLHGFRDAVCLPQDICLVCPSMLGPLRTCSHMVGFASSPNWHGGYWQGCIIPILEQFFFCKLPVFKVCWYIHCGMLHVLTRDWNLTIHSFKDIIIEEMGNWKFIARQPQSIFHSVFVVACDWCPSMHHLQLYNH